jgi:hypothetical protein
VTEEPEQVDVKRVLSERQESPQRLTVGHRLYNALFPVIGGLVLDFTDFVTFGPIGIYFGLLTGGLIGWLISSIYGFSTKKRLLWALLSGIYCTIPVTEFVPVATILSAVARFDKIPPVQK